MKKFLSMAALVLSVMTVLACKSTPSTEEGADFKKVYDRFQGDLILDGAKTYTVVKGDTLAAISRKEYGNGLYFPVIMLASSDVVLDPDKIQPGMKLTVPNLQTNLNDSRAKSKIKSYLGEIATVYDGRSRPADANGLRDLSDSLK